MATPTLSDVDRISAMPDAVLRNLRITQCYAEMSSAFAGLLPGGANWCTFATWASRQAGRSIRSEDVALALEQRLKKLPVLNAIFAELMSVMGLQRDEIIGDVSRVVLRAGGMQRSAAAVAEGNVKVFSEIGREFARCLEMLEAGNDTDAGWSHFLASMRPGDPPDGQAMLVSAFTHYRMARAAGTGSPGAQHMLLANLEIGYHEQTRLQPEIQRALDEALLPHAILEQEVYMAISARLRLLSRIWSFFSPFRESLLRKAAKVITAETVRLARMVVTDHMMSIEFPGPQMLKLGHDLERPFPAVLEHVDLPELLQVLRRIDPTPDSARGSGALDWADFRERIHFIADMFRAWQDEPTLLGSPFGEAQLAMLRAGRVPGGPL
ncbi:MAG: hypothetical protein ABI972_05565 [Acidobacteriota bacterium]